MGMEPVCTIYALYDPRSEETELRRIKYVGRTILHLPARLNAHLRDAKRFHRRRHAWSDTPPRYAWLLGLLREGVRPNIEALELTTDPSREELWIKWAVWNGADLLNRRWHPRSYLL